MDQTKFNEWWKANGEGRAYMLKDDVADAWRAACAENEGEVSRLRTVIDANKDGHAECLEENIMLRGLLAECVPHVMASHGAEHLLDGFRPRARPIDKLVERLEVFMRANVRIEGRGVTAVEAKKHD